MKLEALIASGYGMAERYNCAEKILFGANEVYGLGFPRSHMTVASCFGGGMGVGSDCGALTGALMVLGHLTVVDHSHEGTLAMEVAKAYRAAFQKELEADSVLCSVLKPQYFVPDRSCEQLIIIAARVLDQIIEAYDLVKEA